MQKTHAQHPYEAVIFDLDGTLADTFPTVMRSYNQVMLDYTGRTWTLEEMLPHFGPPEDVIFKKFIQDDARHEAALEDYYRLIEADVVEIKPFAGMRELLAELRAAGKKLAVFTGATTRAGRIRLRHAGLLEFFDEVLGSDGLTYYKPHPEGVWRLLEQFNVAPQAAIFIGDSPLDMQAGRAAGVLTAAVLWGAGTRANLAAMEPDYLIETPNELKQVLFNLTEGPHAIVECFDISGRGRVLMVEYSSNDNLRVNDQVKLVLNNGEVFATHIRGIEMITYKRGTSAHHNLIPLLLANATQFDRSLLIGAKLYCQSDDK